MRRSRWTASRLADLALIGLLGMAVFWAWPAQFGGAMSYVIVSGDSMHPTYESGDIVIARPGDYEVGDAVVYRVPEGEPGAGSRIVHRITGGDGRTGWELTGDNNSGPDQWHPTDGDIQGEVRWHLPGAGRIFLGLANPFLFSALIVVGALLLILPRRGGDDEDTDDDQETSTEGSQDAAGAIGETDLR